MPGMIPGPIGFAAFVGAKFGGYTLAGTFLRKTYPAEQASPLKIAFARTGLGLALGIAHFFVWVKLQDSHVNADPNGVVFIVGLIVLRLLIWTGIIWLFCDRRFEHPLRIFSYAIGGTLLSFC